MRKVNVFCDNKLAETLVQNEFECIFTYDKNYLLDKDARAISLTMPLSEVPYISNVLFPFFDGLIPEGWLLEVALQNWNITRNDRMSILLKTGKDVTGNVTAIENSLLNDKNKMVYINFINNKILNFSYQS